MDPLRPTALAVLRPRTLALLLFLVTLAVSGFSLVTRRQLGFLGGLTDEWLMLGANVAVHRTLGLENEPWVFRPPGYPAFLALAVVTAGTPRVVTQAYVMRVRPVAFFAQAVVLAASASLLFLWLSASLRAPVAFAAGLLYGTNPYSVVLTGLLHYDVLHLFTLIAGCYALDRTVAGGPPRVRPALVAGLVFGLATLVRPLTLLLPPFVIALFLLRSPGSWRAAVRPALAFLLAMALVIAPWTARNYAVSGQLIPVNLQGWAVAWASTVRPLPVTPNHYRWYLLGDDILRVYTRVTGRDVYDLPTLIEHNRELDEAFREEALRNLRERPGVYLGNALGSLVSLNRDINSVLLKAFQRRQGSEDEASEDWFRVGNPQEFGSKGLATAFSLLIDALGVLAVAGLVLALRRRDPFLLAPALVYLCLMLGQGLIYMDLMFYYVKLPFLVAFAFYALDRIPGRPAAAGALALIALCLTGVLLW